MNTQPVTTSPKQPSKRVLPRKPLQAALIICGFVAVLYLLEFIDLWFLRSGLDQEGIRPREVDGLLGILFAPFLHAGWPHLVGNTLPLLVFGFLALAAGTLPFISTTVLIWLVSGIGVWLTGMSGVTIGASGIAFGWLAFLLVRGLFNRSLGQFSVALVLLFFWGTMLFGVLPLDPQISWQAHLFGALGGVLGAWLTAKAAKRNQVKAPAPTQTITPPPGNLTA